MKAARFETQMVTMLDLLKQGPVSNSKLSEIALKYTSRISDLRAQGHKIICERASGGLTYYRLAA